MSDLRNKLETWFYQPKMQKRLVYLTFFAVFFAVFALNYFFPLYADDMLYSVVKFEQSLNLGENLREIGEFMHYYYFNWGGRVVAHFAVHLFLLFGFTAQAFINSVIFCCLIYLIYRIGLRKDRYNFFLLLFIGLAVFYFTPSFLSSAVWKTGSANYLWTTATALAFFLLYYKLAIGKEYKDSTLRIVGFLLFGIVAGWSNENTGPTLFLLVISFLALIYFRQKRRIPLWAIVGLIGVIIGCSLMILAPGNAVRAEAEGHLGLFSSLEKIGHRLPYIWGSYRHFMLRPIIIYLVCIGLHHFFAKNKKTRKDTLIYSLVFFLIANISIWLTVLAPSFPPRAFFIITVLTIVSIAILYGNIDFKQIMPKVLNLMLLAVLIICASKDYITFLKGTYFLHKEMAKREVYISDNIKKGNRNITFEVIYMDYRFEYTDYTVYYRHYYDIEATFVDKIEEKK